MEPLRDKRELPARPMRDIVLEESMDEWRSVVLRKLIDGGMDPNYVWHIGDGLGDTPLITAARHGNITAINTLLDAGANVRARNRKGRNALMVAIIQREACDLIHARGGNADEEHWIRQERARDEDRPELPGLTSCTPGKIAISRLSEITERLITAGLCINEQDEDGFTALHLFFHGSHFQPFVPTFNYQINDNRSLMIEESEKQFLRLLINRRGPVYKCRNKR